MLVVMHVSILLWYCIKLDIVFIVVGMLMGVVALEGQYIVQIFSGCSVRCPGGATSMLGAQKNQAIPISIPTTLLYMHFSSYIFCLLSSSFYIDKKENCDIFSSHHFKS